jgi:hypothetical protein
MRHTARLGYARWGLDGAGQRRQAWKPNSGHVGFPAQPQALKSRGPGPRFIQVPESAAAGGAAALIDKHSETIEQLRLRLGFEKDTTVIAWLLEQIEQSPDLSKTIADLLGCK